ncbi:MAG TPA: tetratricopeptide repeat protein [Candidatus Hydrogenedentes bacterium]|nr:tetratricopeptide repeat protein [Candidatus Hydrogenedentota bacterium]HOL76768.1 tetratricopeptide repeat protein [Candidatus Hydrogenedentota bacterium]HPO85271.1 tetratricopeptide repeat protein [Candidatus Hydrogenedentota bacterium]
MFTGKVLTVACSVLAALLVLQTVRLERLEKRYLAEIQSLNEKGVIPLDAAPAAASLVLGADAQYAASGAVAPSTQQADDPVNALSKDAVKGTSRDAKDDDVKKNESLASTQTLRHRREGARAAAKRNGVSPNAGTGTDAQADRRHSSARNSPKKRGDFPHSLSNAFTKQWVNEARQAAARGDYDTATDLLNRTLSVDPTNRDAYRNLGRVQHQLGMTDLELQTYQQWADALPTDATPHYLLAQVYQQMGAADLAAQELSIYEGLNRGSLDMYAQAASLYRRLNMPQQEAAVLSQWVQEAPNSPDAHRSLADYYRRTGNFSAALNEYQQLVALTPNNAQAHVSMAQALVQMRLYADAQNAYLTALSLQPNDLGIRLQLAQAYRAAGDIASAIGAYQSVIELNPTSREATRAARAIQQLQSQAHQTNS